MLMVAVLRTVNRSSQTRLLLLLLLLLWKVSKLLAARLLRNTQISHLPIHQHPPRQSGNPIPGLRWRHARARRRRPR
uniref:Putative secreted protein n=1 Tax=Anopheles marajoara TaxID=58244 RepID=A0A2M4CCF2_9DIPT